jgi:uncharacterized RDD family membrane protein YckC
MKCPKCSYIGFEDAQRCRNCGYEFALADLPATAPDLPIRAAGDDDGPLADLVLRSRPGSEAAARAEANRARSRLNLDRVLDGDRPSRDLPLFEAGSDADDLAPLVTSVPPRRPLAVRRQTPQPSRSSLPDVSESAGTLDLPLPAERSPAAWVPTGTGSREELDLAGPVRRLAAACLDLAMLSGVHALTVYFTLRLCGLSSGDWRLLPLVPLGAFFFLVDAAYLIAFTTAGGQTIGKMAFGLRVVRDAGEPMSAGVAAARALGAIASTLCLGMGLVPAFTRDDRRAIHDRLARTHVVRVTA